MQGKRLLSLLVSCGSVVGCGGGAASPKPEEPVFHRQEPTPPTESERCAGGDLAVCQALGERQEGAGEPEAAIASFQVICHRGGDTYYCFHAIELLRDKLGDPARATRFVDDAIAALDGACEQGDRAACHSAGRLYHLERGQPEEGLARYERACDGGEREACVSAGIVLQEGKQLERARAYFGRSCEAGSGQGCFFAGSLELLELGERERAIELYRRSCDLGFQMGCDNLETLGR
jgi:TPR repeat protein